MSCNRTECQPGCVSVWERTRLEAIVLCERAGGLILRTYDVELAKGERVHGGCS